MAPLEGHGTTCRIYCIEASLSWFGDPSRGGQKGQNCSEAIIISGKFQTETKLAIRRGDPDIV